MATELVVTHRAPATARRMADAANRFLESLSGAQRAVATFPFAGDERYEWHYTPVPRNGLLLKDMTGPQRTAALALFDAGLSARGSREAREIVALETILREMEEREGRPSRWDRDPELYYFSVFGEPGGPAPWAWRAGGHHIGLHFTVIDRELVAPLPLFFGSDPAEVMHGPEKGKRILAAEEDLARALLRSLDASQKAVAVVDPVAPDDILTKNYRTADPSVPLSGLRYAAMSGEQRGRLAGPLLRRQGADVPARVRQHPARRQPHPLGLARLHQRLGRRPAGRPLRGIAPLTSGGPSDGIRRPTPPARPARRPPGRRPRLAGVRSDDLRARRPGPRRDPCDVRPERRRRRRRAPGPGRRGRPDAGHSPEAPGDPRSGRRLARGRREDYRLHRLAGGLPRHG
jgi:hypothetical protein